MLFRWPLIITFSVLVQVLVRADPALVANAHLIGELQPPLLGFRAAIVQAVSLEFLLFLSFPFGHNTRLQVLSP